jgi:hypothetical protein
MTVGPEILFYLVLSFFCAGVGGLIIFYSIMSSNLEKKYKAHKKPVTTKKSKSNGRVSK